MILTVQRHVHDAIADAVRRQFGVAEVPPFAVEVPPSRALGDLAVTVAFQLARTLRKAPRAIAQELAGALGTIPGVAAWIADAERLPEPVSRSAGVSAGTRARRRSAAGPTAADEDHRRAHGDQPEQGGAHRPPAQRGARRHARPRAALPRHAGRGAELHRRHRRPGRRRHRRLPRARAPDARRRPAHRRHDAVRLLLLGSVFARHRVVRRRQGHGSRFAPPRSTISSTAATRPPRSARSSSTASSART